MTDKWPCHTVMALQREGVLLVEDGNHGEYRPRPDEFVGAGVAFIRAADMDSGRVLFDKAAKINQRARDRITKGVGKPGDVLLSHKGTVGKVAFVPLDAPAFVCSPQTTFWRTLDETRIDRRYLHVFLKSQRFQTQLATRAGETDMAPYVSLTSQRGLSVLCPPIAEQRAIAHILGTLDDKIALNRRMNETLEGIARTIFQSWFVDFEPVRANASGEPPESICRRLGLTPELLALFPDRLVEFELGEIPEGWEVKPLAQVTSYLSRGISPKYVESGGVLVLNQKCVRDGRVATSKARRHDPAQRSVAGRLVEVGDVLVNSTGVGTLGRVAQVLAIDEPTIVDSHVTVVRADPAQVSWNFLGVAMQERESDIEALGEGSTGQTELSRVRLGGLPLLMPPQPLCNCFDEAVLPLRLHTKRNDEQNETLASIRDALLPKLLSGEIRVPPEVVAHP